MPLPAPLLLQVKAVLLRGDIGSALTSCFRRERHLVKMLKQRERFDSLVHMTCSSLYEMQLKIFLAMVLLFWRLFMANQVARLQFDLGSPASGGCANFLYQYGVM
ncbi:hypothetical protein F0562_009566 [Nyssa sinensis]|uniref:Uncharacterized protein n=1 Tax=Nyssa sinensis TaxID=561372 RepID=A0A5J4ZWD7_9ASTE|nr:hypothetical protein F0562_009566 [Nyssa sinensis]